jgi:hypothetical protein
MSHQIRLGVCLVHSVCCLSCSSGLWLSAAAALVRMSEHLGLQLVCMTACLCVAAAHVLFWL